MLNKIPYRFAIKSMLILLFLVMLFHILVLVQFIPFEIVWGSRLENVDQMRSFETISLIINAFFIIVIAIKAGYVRLKIPSKLILIIIWCMVALFLLNTLGNLFSKNLFEKLVFTPLTFISALFCLRILRERK